MRSRLEEVQIILDHDEDVLKRLENIKSENLRVRGIYEKGIKDYDEESLLGKGRYDGHGNAIGEYKRRNEREIAELDRQLVYYESKIAEFRTFVEAYRAERDKLQELQERQAELKGEKLTK